MSLRTTAQADEHIRAIDEWWRQNRTASPDLFVNELADAFAMITAAPRLGRPYPSADIPDVRRVLMRATRYHVYFRIDGNDVIVLAVWSALRGRGPSL
jgi:plasmid stabilization system protein ParE